MTSNRFEDAFAASIESIQLEKSEAFFSEIGLF